jgi:hypothetical protein
MIMKDDNQLVVLESLVEEVKKLKRAVADQQPILLQYGERIEQIMRQLDSFSTSGLMENDGERQRADQQRLIDLRLQLDRLLAKLRKEDGLLYYYLSSPKIAFLTIMIVLLSFLIGTASERFGLFNSKSMVHRTDNLDR